MWAACLALVAIAGVQLGAQTTPLRKIYEMDLAIRALSATVEPTLVMPKAVAGGVRISLRSGSRELSLADAARVLGGDVHVEGELSGPGLPQTLTLPRPPSEDEPALPGDNDPLLLRLPALPTAGNYALANLRLVRGTTTVLDVTPRQVDIQVIDEVLITSVKTRSLTLDEIKSKGIVLDSDDYLGFEFTLAMKLESTPVNVTFPVVFDRQNIPLPELLKPPSVSREGVRLPTMVPVMLEPEAPDGAGPGEKIALTLEEREQARIPGILVIPGNVGYLRQFFSAQLFVANGAPAGSRLSVHSVTGTIELPKGDDRELGTKDDPLSLAETATGTNGKLHVRALGPDGQSGTGDDVDTLHPGEQGQAEFLLRGDQEGFHDIHFDIRAVLEGLAVGPVALKGRASGGVLVRNVYYDITFAAPAVVRDGERFKIFATVTNISQAIGNDIQVAIDAARLGNMRLFDASKGTQSIKTLMPGDAQTLEFEFVSEQTGQVVASYLKFNTTDGSTGRLNFFAAIGDRGVPLSPDTLVLPAVVDALPDNVLHAAMRVLGQAWSAATAPPGTLPGTVTRPSPQLVLKKAQAVAEAGLRMTLGQTLDGALRDLTFDLYGGAGTTDQAASLQTRIDRGFDQVVRETSAGYALAQALGAALAPAASTAGGVLAFERDVARVAVSGPDFISLAVQGASDDALDISVTNSSGQRSLLPRSKTDRPESAVPGLVFLPLGEVPAAQTLALLATTAGAPYTIDFAGRGGTSTSLTFSVTLPRVDGTFTRGQIASVTLPAQARGRLVVNPTYPDALVLQVDVNGDGVAESEHPLMLETLHPEGARLLSANIIGPETLDNAAPFGQHAVLVFDRLVDAAAAADPNLYTVPKNAILGARSVLSGRLVVLSLEQPEGSYLPTTLAVSGMPDLRGVTGAGSGPIALGMRLRDDGAVVTGRVLEADGTPVSGGTLFYRNNKDLIECKLPPGGLPAISKVTLDADGRYEFRYVRQDKNCGFPFEITTVDPGTGGVVGTQRFVRAAGEHIVVDLLMFGRGSVTGTVRDVYGKGVGGAEVVVLSGTDSQIGGKTTTNGDGLYTVHGITVGQVAVRAAKRGSLGYAAGRIDRAGTTTTIDVSLDGGTVTVEGTVLRREGDTTVALPGAWVGYRVGSRTGTVVGAAQANELGKYKLEGMPTGAFALDATSEGFHGYVDGVAAADDHLNRDITIERPGVDNSGTVRGIVRYPSGAEGADAYVTVDGANRGALTKADGTFVVSVPAGRPATIRATLRNMSRSGSTTVQLANPGDELNNVEIRLSGLARAVVTVYEPDGKTRVPNVTVRRLDCNDPCGCAAGTTDQDGQVTIEGLKLGTRQFLVVRAVGAGVDEARGSVTLSSDNQTGTADLQFKGHGTVFGTVRDADGALLHGADIELTSMMFVNDGAMCGLMPKVSHRVRTDTSGAFRITGVNVGPLGIIASHFAAPRRVGQQGALLAAGRDVEFNLKLIDTMAGELSGTVVLPDNVTPAGAGVEVTVSGMLPDITVRTDDAGRFAFAKILSEGNWTLTARDPITGGLVQTLVALQTGQPATHKLRLKGRGTVRVTVVDAADNEVTSAHVKLTEVDFPRRTYERSIEAAHEGVATFERIFEGDITLEASDSFGRGGRLSTVVAGPDAVVDAKIRLSMTGTVTGRFFIPDPVHGTKPVSYGVVKLLSGNRVIGQATSSADPDPEKTGTFTFDYVPAGPFRLEAQDPASARTGVAAGTITLQDEKVKVDVIAQALGTVTGEASSNTYPQPNARITVQSGQFKADTIADHLGRYVVTGVPEGRVIVTASLDGGAYLRGTAEGTLAGENATLTLDVSLHDSGTVEGQVTKSSGAVAPYVLVAASVTGSGGNRQTTTADGEGRFRFDHMPTGSVTVDVEQPGSIDRGRATVNVLAEQTVSVPVQLNGVGALRVFARNKQNQPTGGYVEIKGTGTFPYTRGFTIGSDGDLTIPELLAGPVSVTLRTSSGTFSSYGTTTGAVTANQPPNQPDTVTVQIQDTGTVRGRVVGTDGVTAVGAAIVNVTVANVAGVLSGATQPDGSFELHGVPLGSVTVRVSDPLGVGVKSGLTLSADPGEVNAGTIVLDDSAVTVVGIEPATGTPGVSTSTVVRVTFSDPLASTTGISVWNGAERLYPSIDLIEGDRVVTLTKTWPSESRIEVRVSTDVKDIYGRHLGEEVTSWFRTVDAAPPSVDTITPADGANQINPIGVTVVVDFSEDLDDVNITSVVRLSGPNGTIAGENTLTGRRITFRPAYDLQANARYTVTVSGARDLNGNVQTGSRTARFSTTDTTPPEIRLISPANGSKTTNRRPTITFSVSDAVTDIDPRSGKIAIGTLPEVEATVSNGTLRFTPEQDLPLGTVNVTAKISDVTEHTASASGSFTVQVEPIGGLSGRLFLSDGTTPAAGRTVRVVSPGYSSGGELRVTDANGAFVYETLDARSYDVIAFNADGRIRARERVTVVADTTVTVDVQMAAEGRLVGQVLRPGGTTPAASVPVEVRSHHAQFGGSPYTVTTDANGMYAVERVATGAVSITVNDTKLLQRGEGAGTIVANQTATVNVTLVANAVVLPTQLYDGNNYYIYLYPNGTGDNSPVKFALEIVKDGTTTPFTGASNGSRDGREIAIRQANLAGLDVTRKVFVPSDGYFYRYLELLTNPGTSPVTVTVRVRTGFATGNGNPHIETSSSGDNQFAVGDPATADRWVTLDDSVDADEGTLAMALVFDGDGASDAIDYADWLGTSPARAIVEWRDITIEPGQTAAVLHFGAHLPNRAGAKYAAERLVQLPPEALVGLNEDEIESIRNFVVPADGVGRVPALPAFNGAISGTVFTGVGTSTVSSSRVKFRSAHPLFGRTWEATTNSSGFYQFNPTINTSGTTRLFPIHDFVLTATHPVTAVVATSDVGSFPAPPAVTADVVFRGTGHVRGTVRWRTGAVVPHATIYVPKADGSGDAQFSADANGAYVQTGIPEGTHTIKATWSHPNGPNISSTTTATVTAGEIAQADITMPAVGAVTGTLRQADGTAISGRQAYTTVVNQADGRSWGVWSITSTGKFTIPNLPIGAYWLRANDPVTNVLAQASLIVTENVTTTQDLTFIAHGTVTLQVFRANGAPATGINVHITEAGRGGTRRHIGLVDANGRITITGVALGAFTVDAYPGSNTRFTGLASGEIANQGQTVGLTLTLPPYGIITGRVTRATGAAASYAWVQAFRANNVYEGETANSDGYYTLDEVWANEPIRLNASSGVESRQVMTSLVDGETKEINLVLTALATVRVTVRRADGTPIPSTTVKRHDAYDGASFPSRTTNASGVATFTDVREGPALFVATDIHARVTYTVLPSDQGKTIDLTITEPPTGTLRGTVFAADGVTPVRNSVIRVYDPDTADHWYSAATNSETGVYQIANVRGDKLLVRASAPAPLDSNITVEKLTAIQTAGATETVNLNLPVSAVVGRVYFGDGFTPVSRPSVVVSQPGASPGASPRTVIQNWNNTNGEYVVITPALGDFTITAQDSASGLMGETTGTVVQPELTVPLDITLQQSGTVTGVLRYASGSPVSGHLVRVASSGLAMDRGLYTGGGGQYTFNRVAAGTILLHAHTGTVVAGAHTTIAAQDETVTANLSYLPTGTVRGKVFAADGVTPVAGATVHVYAHGPHVADNTPSASATTDAAGQFTASNVPHGVVRAVATSGTPNYQAGLVDGVLTAAGPLDAPPIVLNDNARWLYNARTHVLTDAGGFRYDLGCRGEITDGSSNAYNYSVKLTVSGVPFPCATGATASPDGRTTGFGPFSFSNAVRVTRDVFVPTDGSFARYVESFTNETAAPISISVQVASDLGANWNNIVIVAPSTTGGTFAVTDNGTDGGTGSPAVGHVFAGAGAALMPIAQFYTGNWTPTLRWQLTIAPGQTVSLMHFQTQRLLRADAQAQAAALANLTDPVALIGLTPAQRASIVNFVVP